MDMGTRIKLVPPPAPEPPALKRFRLLLSAGLLTLAFLIVWMELILTIHRTLILLYPLLTIACLAGAILFFRAKSRWNRAWWTEERRLAHYQRVRAGLPTVERPAPGFLDPPWRRP